MAQVKPAHDTLYIELNRLANDPSPTEFEIASFRRKVDQIRQSDIFHYREILGGLAALQGDLEESRKQHELAIAQSYSAESLGNYAQSMQKLGEFGAASDLFLRAKNLEPEVVDHWKRLAFSQFLTGDFLGAEGTLTELIAKAPEAYEGDGKREVIQAAARIAKEREIDGEELRAIPRLAISCARQQQVSKFSTQVAMLEDAESEWVSLLIGVNGSACAKVVSLNDSFADALVESDISSNALTAFLVRFITADGDKPI